jgi:glycosyltransferase involved in cell wall biosynthesis
MNVAATSSVPLPILVKTWSGRGSHRFGYIRRSLPSLLASDLPGNAHVLVVDDQSDDPRLVGFLERLASEDPRVRVWKNPTRMGPNLGQEYNVPRVVERFPDAEFLVFCDDDIVYHPGWLQRTLQVATEAASAGLTGVFTALNVPFRAAYGERRMPTSDLLLKERQAALNWVMPRSVYDRVGPFKDAGIAYDTEYCDRMAALKIPVICLRPSWVQNIGYFGAYQSSTTFTAPDYVGKLSLYLMAARQYHSRKAALREFASSVKQRVMPSRNST